jgi:hypothetical protein
VEQDSDDEDHLYQLIQGVPAVMVSNGNSQSKMILSRKEKSLVEFLNPTKKGILVVKTCFSTKEAKMSERGKTEFNVSFDGFFSQRFEDTQVIVSLPIIDGLGSSELRTYLPKRGEDSSECSSKSDERTTGERSESSKTGSFQAKCCIFLDFGQI